MCVPRSLQSHTIVDSESRALACSRMDSSGGLRILRVVWTTTELQVIRRCVEACPGPSCLGAVRVGGSGQMAVVLAGSGACAFPEPPSIPTDLLISWCACRITLIAQIWQALPLMLARLCELAEHDGHRTFRMEVNLTPHYCTVATTVLHQFCVRVMRGSGVWPPGSSAPQDKAGFMQERDKAWRALFHFKSIETARHMFAFSVRRRLTVTVHLTRPPTSNIRTRTFPSPIDVSKIFTVNPRMNTLACAVSCACLLSQACRSKVNTLAQHAQRAVEDKRQRTCACRHRNHLHQRGREQTPQQQHARRLRQRRRRQRKRQSAALTWKALALASRVDAEVTDARDRMLPALVVFPSSSSSFQGSTTCKWCRRGKFGTHRVSTTTVTCWFHRMDLSRKSRCDGAGSHRSSP